MPSETASLSRLLAFLRPGVALTPASAKQLAWDLRRIAKQCEKFAGGGGLSASDAASSDNIVKPRKAFEFDRFSVRYVALRLMYVGWAYHGFTLQDTATNTVEASLFGALEKTCLIRPGLTNKEMRYTRCGRTDIGVSALANVVTLELRSKAKASEPLPEPEEEVDYPLVLNNVLPEDIQVTGWAPVPDDCNARFSATHRQYKYFFPGAGRLDAHAMQKAADYLVGVHDFQHFCKVNFGNTTNYCREIIFAQLLPYPVQLQGTTETLVLVIRGSGFLWHQVRCIAEVLRMVGSGLERPEVVRELLDISANPGRPMYPLASETPLLLHSAGYPDHVAPQFRLSARAAGKLRGKVERLKQQQVGRLALIHEINSSIDELAQGAGAQAEVEEHKPVMQRAKDEPVAQRLRAYLVKQVKLAAEADAEGTQHRPRGKADDVENEEVEGCNLNGIDVQEPAHVKSNDRVGVIT